MLTEKQLEIRKSGIGASESAVILGFSKWRTPAELFMEKTGVLSDETHSEAAHFGNVLEETVAQEYARRKECKVRRNNKTLRHKDHPFILCHLDRVVEGEKRIVECKTSSAYLADKWGEEGTDQVPEEYLIQVQHQMAITGYEVADIPVLIGGNQLKIYTIERDQELIDIIIDQLVNFWENNVQKNIAPDFDYDHSTTEELLKRLHEGTDGTEIDITSVEHWHKTKLEAAAKVKEYEAVVQGCKNHILAAVGNSASGIIDGVGSYNRKLVKRKAFEVSASESIRLSFKKEK